ncbi:MAG: P-loop NTPase fold protein [Desulfuromonadaceae bacterium]|nr:P-loop NTPase fold protein [Desulfuromonadaceae bacterium]
MWADTDTDQDFLNYSEVAELANELISNQSMLPLSLGIFGGWGSGKSSMLRLLESSLNDSEQDFLIVKFDAWLYQNFDDARAALMEVVASTLMQAADADEGLIKKIKKFSGRIDVLRAFGMLADAGATIAGFPTFGLLSKGAQSIGQIINGDSSQEDYQAVKDAASDIKEKTQGVLKDSEKRTPPAEIAAFRQEFSEILGSLGKTLVVFIDNLDRCLPKNAIQTLEAVRLFLFLPQSAFVIAADEEMIRHAVSEHYGNLNERLVTDYLDKLIQVPIRVPRLGVHEVRAYMFMLFAIAAKVDDKSLERLRYELVLNLRECWRQEPISKETAIGLLGESATEELANAFGIADRMATILANSSRVEGNPRIVKRMLNVVSMRSRIAQRRGMSLDESIIAKIALFERCTDNQATSELYRLINEAANGKAEIISKLEEVTEDLENFKKICPENWHQKHISFIIEWFQLEPHLAGVDLRPALYLSRETMPLRFSRTSLSAQAADTLNILLRAKTTNSPSAKQAVGGLDSSESVSVMEALVTELRKESSWTRKPAGFDGAIILAEQTSNSGKILADFIHSLRLVKLPPWLNVLVKNADWYNGKEGS